MTQLHYSPAAAPGRAPVVDVAALRQLGLPLTSLTADSRQVLPGMTFVAYPGGAHDGREFIEQAIQAGAAAVLWEKEGFSWKEQWHVPQQGIFQLRSQISAIASAVYDHPSHHMPVVGVTGTNGKTSCTHWLAGLIQYSLGFAAQGMLPPSASASQSAATPSQTAPTSRPVATLAQSSSASRPVSSAQGPMTAQADFSCAVVGTLGNGFLGQLERTANTTPDAIVLQQSLARYRASGARYCAMEVSSHGLAQERVSGIRFVGAVLTNLSRDHLDYHGSLQAYAAAKTLLFQAVGLEFAVLNLDDALGQALLEQLLGSQTVTPQSTQHDLQQCAQSALTQNSQQVLQSENTQSMQHDLQQGAQPASAPGLQNRTGQNELMSAVKAWTRSLSRQDQSGRDDLTPAGSPGSAAMPEPPLRLIGYTQEGRAIPPGVLGLSAQHIATPVSGTEFTLHSAWGDARIQTALVGRFNVSNLLAVLGAALALGFPLSELVQGVRHLQAPPGRLERLGGQGRPWVVVDYAHTPDALEQVLQTLRSGLLPNSQLWCVFGCGGDRDAGKRPLMGAVAGRLADHVVLTSDNPRFESPETILDQVAAGVNRPYKRIAERDQAIRFALQAARVQDVVLIAGKGHESTQEIAGQSLPFSDRAVVQEWLQEGRA